MDNDKYAQEQLAWHFVGKTLRDGRPIPRTGKWLKHTGFIGIRQSGLHASRHPFDALRYAAGATLCRVAVRHVEKEQDGVLVARERKIIARMDFTKPLRYFARMKALSVINDYPNGTDDDVFDYLMTGDEALRPRALETARITIMAERYMATRRAIWAACWAAAWSAAWSAASAASESAAWASTLPIARVQFANLVSECFGDV